MKTSKQKALELSRKVHNTSHELKWSVAKNSRKCPDCKAVFKSEEEYDKHWH